MNSKLSKRLSEIVDSLPLGKGMRVLEIGCGTGIMAREIARPIVPGHILAIDRSAKAIRQAVSGAQTDVHLSNLQFKQIAIENFELEAKDLPFDMAIAIRVGALDGRHPEI